jgi:hypothetical protein
MFVLKVVTDLTFRHNETVNAPKALPVAHTSENFMPIFIIGLLLRSFLRFHHFGVLFGLLVTVLCSCFLHNTTSQQFVRFNQVLHPEHFPYFHWIMCFPFLLCRYSRTPIRLGLSWQVFVIEICRVGSELPRDWPL